MIGALYHKSSGFYGSYPYKVRERIEALFPDCRILMHLFAGTIQEDKKRGILTYDVSPVFSPTICDDVRNLKKHRTLFRTVDFCLADPPYERSDFERYGLQPFNKPQVIRDLGEIMREGSYLAWLDTRVPIYNKKTWALLGHIGIVVSTNTRARMLTLWEHQ